MSHVPEFDPAQQDAGAMLELPSQPTPDEVLAARLKAGHTQEQAATLVGLSGGIRWSEYERTGPTSRRIDAVRWAMYLLMTDQHPEYRLTRRRGRST